MPAGTSTSWPSMVSLGISGGPPFVCGRNAVLGDAALHLRPEMADQPLHRPHGPVRQGADRMALDLVRNVQQHVDLGPRGFAPDHALHPPPYPAGTFAAWGALAAAFVL